MADPDSITFLEGIYSDVDKIVRKILATLPQPWVGAQAEGDVVSNKFRIFNFTGDGVTVAEEPELRRYNIIIPGAPVSLGSFVLNSTAGVGRILHLTGSEPANWFTNAFVDSGWSVPILQPSNTPAAAIGGTQWITYTTSVVPFDDSALVRHTFTLPAGDVTTAVLELNLDDALDSLYVNGTPVTFPPDVSPYHLTFDVPIALLIPGGSNLLAFRVRNVNPLSTGWIAADYQFTIGSGAAGTDARYQLLSEKDQASGYAGLNSSTRVPVARLGSGSPSSSNFLRGDGAWEPASTNAIIVQEVDASPSGPITTLEFPNTTITNPSAGVARYTPVIGTAYTPILRLDFALATDLTSSITLGTWTDAFANQNFTVGLGTSLVEVSVAGLFRVDTSSTAQIASRIIVDSGGTPITKILGGSIDQGGRHNPLGGGPFWISGLSAGTHTVKVQVYVQTAGGLTAAFNYHPTTLPDVSSISVQVIEHP